jgi:hypothetical protein
MRTFLAACALVALPVAAASPARVLIVMDEREQMETVARQLKAKAGLEIVITDQKTMPADWSGFDAVIAYIHGTLAEPTEQKIIAYTRGGGRYVCLHHSISGGKAKNQDYFDFLGVRLDGAEQSKEPAPPGGHYAWHEGAPVTIVNLNPQHYITRNEVVWPDRIQYESSDAPSVAREYPAFTLPRSEAYMNHRYTDGREKTILLGFRHLDDRNGALYMQDREGWLKPSGAGFIVYLQMGHFAQEFENPAVAQMILNAVTWKP